MATQTLTQNPYSTVKKSTAPGSYNPPNPYKSVGMSKAPVNSYNKVVSPYSSVGVKPKAPQQVKPTNTLQNNQVRTTTTQAPMDFTNQNAGLLAALARQKAGTASDTDRKNLTYAQSRGWSGANYGTNPLSDFNVPSQLEQSSLNNYKAPTDISSGGILSSLVDTSNEGSDFVDKSAEGLFGISQSNPGTSGKAYDDYQKAVNELSNLRGSIANATAANESNPIPLEFQQGRQQVMDKKNALLLDAAQQKTNEKQQAVQNQIAGAQAQQTGYNYAGSLGNTAQGLRQSGLQGAAQYAQPVQVPYSNQYINPQTGMPIGGGGGGGAVGGSLQSSVQNIAQRVLSGNMGYDAGVQALSAYGQAGVNSLLQTLGPNFNVQQSNARAQAQGASTLQTGTTGGVITKSADSANKALDSLQLAFNKLSKLQTGGIPATNNIANWIANQFGQGALSSYNSILHDARAQLSGVLTSTGAVSPTGAEAMAQAYLPDNMTPTMFKNKLKAAKDLVAQKVSAFTNTSGGNQNYNSGGGGGGLWNW